MKTFEIYYDDLNMEAQERFDKMFGTPDTHNHEICPLAIYQQESGDDFDLTPA